MADMRNIGADLFSSGQLGGGGAAASGNGALLCLIPNVDFSRGYSLQGATPFAFVNANLQTPIAGFVNNAPGCKPGQQNCLQKLAANCRESFDRIKQAGDELVRAGAQSCVIQPGERIASGLAAPSAGAGVEIG